jgi:protein-tyrosine phosphatase
MQAPLEQTQEHFEQMIRENQIECVVMLCNIIENGKIRCFDYTSNRNKQCISSENNSILISEINLENSSYVHIHYTQWPDRSVPENNT